MQLLYLNPLSDFRPNTRQESSLWIQIQHGTNSRICNTHMQNNFNFGRSYSCMQYDRLLAWYCSVCLPVTKHIVALRVGLGVESCIIVFIGGHFLFTSSDTFAVGWKTKLPKFPCLDSVVMWPCHKMSNRALSMCLIYWPDGTDIYRARGREFKGAWSA